MVEAGGVLNGTAGTSPATGDLDGTDVDSSAAFVVQNAAAKTAGQWKTWYWICFGGIIFFLLSIPLLRGRWRTRDAKRDDAEHEAKVQEELAKLQATV